MSSPGFVRVVPAFERALYVAVRLLVKPRHVAE
jgi:hypothetical protein